MEDRPNCLVNWTPAADWPRLNKAARPKGSFVDKHRRFDAAEMKKIFYFEPLGYDSAES
jgi:hypothetical protein